MLLVALSLALIASVAVAFYVTRRLVDLADQLQATAGLESLGTALSASHTSSDVVHAGALALLRSTHANAAAVAVVHTGGGSQIVETLGEGDLESIIGCVPLEIPDTLVRPNERLALVPFATPTGVLGAVVLWFDRPRALTSAECEWLMVAGRRTGEALARARAYDSAEQARVDGEAFRVRADAELQERRRAEEAHRESEARYRILAARTHRLHNLSAALSEAVALDAVAKAVVRQGRAVVGAAAAAVALCADEDEFETLYAEEYPPAVVEAWPRFAAEPGMCTTAAIASRQPTLIGSFDKWHAEHPRSAATAADGGFASAAVLPLLVENAPIGVLSLHFTVPVNFDPEYRALLTSVAHHAAQAIDRARLYEATQRARVDAEAANRAKDDFLSIVSHELRTPLNAILGWGAMLRDGALEPSRARRATAAIVNNAARQARLIDDLLEVSRIVAGRVSLDPQELDLADIVRGAAEAMLPDAAQRGLELRFERVPHARVVADPHRLEQVFVNLLANAVKFTPAGGEVTVEGGIENDMVRVRVSDTGCGIDPQVLPYIFDRFRQGHNTATVRGAHGLGLGLFIVRRLLEAQQGEVSAESAGKDAGTTFTVSLPLSAAAAPRRLDDPPRTRLKPSLADVHVLVVDDEVDAREMISSALELSGATVTSASSAEEALATLTQQGACIDVILSDLAMPGDDGYQLIRSIRTSPDPVVAHLPAGAVTACAREDERQYALSAGFQLHLAKPIAPGTLVDAVAQLAGRFTVNATSV
jgi:signal transduction histidine kinase/CheY-like chemotaxis protein